MATDAGQEPRLEFLDGLRACAILPVVFFHAWLHSPALQATRSWRLASLGSHGVELFFVISGFCLAYPTLRKVAAGAEFAFDYRTFIARRFARIFPPFWVALTAFVLVAIARPSWQSMANAGGWFFPGYSTAETVQEYLLLDGGPLHNPSFWSLCVELRWYLLFPLALALFVKSPRSVVAVGLAAWCLFATSSVRAIDLQVLPAFLLGILAADAFVARRPWTRYAPHTFLALLAFALSQGGDHITRGPVWQLLAFLFVLSAIELAWLRRVLSWKPIVAIGVASYSIYLVHEPLTIWLDTNRIAPLAVIASALVAGIGFWACVERPLMRPACRNAVASWIDAAFACARAIVALRPRKLPAPNHRGTAAPEPSR